MKVFFDTNVLVGIIDNNVKLSTEHDYVTFEKCVYEIKNGYKARLYDSTFLNILLSAQIDNDFSELKLIDKKILDNFMPRISKNKYSEKQKIEIRKAFNKYLLKFEYGIASEYEFIDLPKNDSIGLLKDLFKQLKLLLRTILTDIDFKIKEHKIEVLLYEQIFGSDLAMTNFREILDDSLINTKDLEIVFAALKANCNLFISSDLPLIKETMTLGLNHSTSFEYLNPDKMIENEIHKIINTVHNTRYSQ
jgi:hypothetical protein